MAAPSDRILRAVEALPLSPGMRVLEIGCGPGAAARAVLSRLGKSGFVLGIDRSPTAIALAERGSTVQIASGCLAFRTVAIEDLVMGPTEPLFDLAFALRVGALDGRHPEIAARALARIAACLRPGGKLLVDTGSPLVEIPLTANG